MNRKEEILHRALLLFSKYGYDSVSISKITKSVGIAKSTLYSHFKSKEEILSTLFEKYNELKVLKKSNLKALNSIIDNETATSFWLKVYGQIISNRTSDFSVLMNRFLVMEQFKNEVAMNYILDDIETSISKTLYIYNYMNKIGIVKVQDPLLVSETFYYTIKSMLLELDLHISQERPTEKVVNRINDFIIRFINGISS